MSQPDGNSMGNLLNKKSAGDAKTSHGRFEPEATPEISITLVREFPNGVSGQECMTLDPSKLTSAIKSDLSLYYSVDDKRIQLFYRGKELFDNQTFLDQGVGSFDHVVMRDSNLVYQHDP